jgi:hypothetical protein
VVGGTAYVDDISLTSTSGSPRHALVVTDNPIFTGNVGIGATGVDTLSIGTAINASATHALLNLSNTALSSGSANGTYLGANPASFTGDFIDLQNNGTKEFTVSSNGTGYLGASSWSYLSDQTQKNNIIYMADATDFDALSVVGQLKPATFNYNNGAQNEAGFIAQDLQTVLPNLVVQNSNGLLSLKTDDLIPYTVAAIQELNLNIDGVAGTITPIVGSTNENFVTAFFKNVENKITSWLADAGNGIIDLYATVIHSDKVETKEVNTDKLCVKKSDGTNVCVTGDQLDSLLTGTKGSVTNNTGGSGNSGAIVCTGKQTLVNNVCTDPAPVPSIPTCSSPQVLDTTTNTCVTPAPVVPTCISPQTLVNNVCTDPAPIVPVCTGTQTLVNNVCVDPANADGTVAS